LAGSLRRLNTVLFLCGCGLGFFPFRPPGPDAYDEVGMLVMSKKGWKQGEEQVTKKVMRRGVPNARSWKKVAEWV
jgi:hypothetical protein